MVVALGTHVQYLEQTAAEFPSRPVFKIPRGVSDDGSRAEGWNSITYARFLGDVENAAAYWLHELSSRGVTGHVPVGIWVKGMTYQDVVLVYGVQRAGFIHQLVSLRMSSPEAIHLLIERAGAKALIADADFHSVVADGCPVPALKTFNTNGIKAPNVDDLPPMWKPSGPRDIVAIYHTSGSTSGIPKLVPYDAAWVATLWDKMGDLEYFDESKLNVLSWVGSICHGAQSNVVLSALKSGASIVQPARFPIQPDDIPPLIQRTSLNTLILFSSFLAAALERSRTDAALLAALKGLDSVTYSGLSLPSAPKEWGRRNGVRLRNIFANTEVGTMMVSSGGFASGEDPDVMRLMGGMKYLLEPVAATTTASRSEAPARGGGQQTMNSDDDDGPSTAQRLLELVVLPDSPDAPHASLRGGVDRPFRTGDLWREVAGQPGSYVFMGRDDDWIKMENALRCDARSVEDNLLSSCGDDLVSACVVVGSGRPCPIVFVEPREVGAEEKEGKVKLAREVFGRIRGFHERRYAHERIDDAKFVVVVGRAVLPRSGKGNIRRQAVESMFKEEIDRLFAQ